MSIILILGIMFVLYKFADYAFGDNANNENRCGGNYDDDWDEDEEDVKPKRKIKKNVPVSIKAKKIK